MSVSNAARRWVNISRLPRDRKRALWRRIQSELPDLARMLSDDEAFAELRAAFGQPDVLIQSPDDGGVEC